MTTAKPKTIKKARVIKDKDIKVAESPIVENETETELEADLETELDQELGLESDVETTDEDKKEEKYFRAIGRRKEAVAIIRLFTKKSSDSNLEEKALIRVNNKDYSEYFTDPNLQAIIESPLKKLKSLNRFKATVLVRGGGIAGQADAIKHGLSRALVLFDLNFRKKLKKSGFLTRDSRVKERRKYGLKKARKAPQWQKR